MAERDALPSEAKVSLKDTSGRAIVSCGTFTLPRDLPAYHGRVHSSEDRRASFVPGQVAALSHTSKDCHFHTTRHTTCHTPNARHAPRP